MNSVIMFGLALMVSDTSRARADVPPPSDYVEKCTVAKQQEGGKQCVACDAWHGEVDKCDKSVGTQGYERICKSWGASSWTEVWCKSSGATKLVDPAPTPAPTPATTPDAGTGDKPADKPANDPPMPKTADVPAPKKSNCAGGGAESVLALGGALWLLARRRAR